MTGVLGPVTARSHFGVDEVKARLCRDAFRLARIRRIHIVGCARSGTTMLHLAMACFANALLSEDESGINYPYLRKRVSLALRFGWRPGTRWYITKRGVNWARPDNVVQLIQRVQFEQIGLIHLVRDPRDVMLSRHSGQDQPYVSPEDWYESIVSADRIWAALNNYSRKVTIRYEDLVCHPERTEADLMRAFGLHRNPNAFSIDRVADNFERLVFRFEAHQLEALNGLRNMDRNSVGKWRSIDDSPIGQMSAVIKARFDSFCAEHAYGPGDFSDATERLPSRAEIRPQEPR
jgi:hypothetical protein